MGEKREAIRLDGATFGQYRHVCAFFHDLDEEYKVLLPFIKEGIERGEKALQIVDSKLRSEHLRRLEGISINVAAAERNGQLEVRIWEEAYLRGGLFDQDAMLALIEEMLSNSKAQGFPLTRLIVNMEWALEDKPGVHNLIEYETRLNYILPKYDDPVI